MALTRINQTSSGIVFEEIDLTVAIQSAGTFAGASIGLTEKGPAFAVVSSAGFEERKLRLGDLNTKYPSSYFAREFLAQAANYKEVRVLGLEGYNDTRAAVVMYNMPGFPPTPGTATTPVIATLNSVAAVLKFRKGTGEDNDFTGMSPVDTVTFTTTTQRDGTTVSATDDLFGIVITLQDATVINTVGSLRPDTKEYLPKVFGTDPRDKTLVQGQPSVLWVDYIIPSIQRRVTDTVLDPGETYLGVTAAAYRYPGVASDFSFLDIAIEVNPGADHFVIDTAFLYPTATMTSITGDNLTVTVLEAAHTFVDGDQIIIGSVAGTGNIALANGTWTVIGAVPGVSFRLSEDGINDVTGINGTDVSGNGLMSYDFVATWEEEILNLGGTTAPVTFQTPITPWFVSDFDNIGGVQRLFRLWSISDGEAANTEIKVEVSNINPQGNNGKGTFDLFIRKFNDAEDTQREVLEGFVKLTMDPTSDNYILRRIGDGENFQLKSRYVFLEINDINWNADGEVLPDDALPYGVEGYTNSTGIVFPEVVWTTKYNLDKPLGKQYLGLANNSINMYEKLYADKLAYRQVTNLGAARSIGFHLNPELNVQYDPTLWATAADAPSYNSQNGTVYQISATNTGNITPAVKATRSKYVVAFEGGFDGWNAYADTSVELGNPTSKSYEAFTTAIDLLNDAENLETDFSVCVTPDINFEDHSDLCAATLEMVTQRGDAMYLPDLRYSFEALAQSAADAVDGSDMKSTHAAIYFPHVQIEDEVNKVNVWLPGSVVAFATIASTATNEQVWQPPAGSLRTIATNLVRTRRRMRLPDREILKGANINPITLFPGSGFEITESRTTQEVFSALSFIHNRLLLGFAKKALNQTLRPLLHQLNGNLTKEAFINTVTPIFERIKKLNGVEDFTVKVADQVEDRTQLTGVIEIVALFPVEKIKVNFVVSNTGTQFSQ